MTNTKILGVPTADEFRERSSREDKVSEINLEENNIWEDNSIEFFHDWLTHTYGDEIMKSYNDPSTYEIQLTVADSDYASKMEDKSKLYVNKTPSFEAFEYYMKALYGYSVWYQCSLKKILEIDNGDNGERQIIFVGKTYTIRW